MNRNIALIILLILFAFGIAYGTELIWQSPAEKTCEDVGPSVAAKSCMEDSYTSKSVAMGYRNSSAFKTESPINYHVQLILPSRNDYYERIQTLKFFPINPASDQMLRWPEQFAQNQSKLPGQEFHSSKFACHYYVHSLCRMLI